MAVLGHLKRTLSQLFPVALGRIADRCLPRVRVQHHPVSQWCQSDNADNAGRSFPTGRKGMSQGVMETYMVTTAGEGGGTLPQ